MYSIILVVLTIELKHSVQARKEFFLQTYIKKDLTLQKKLVYYQHQGIKKFHKRYLKINHLKLQ